MVFLAALSAGTVDGGLVNADFETIDDPSLSMYFDSASGWEFDNYAAVVEHFMPDPTGSESTANWYPPIVTDGLDPFTGNSFCLLSTGFIGGGGDGWIQQSITTLPGETLTGKFFFGAFDYASFCDFATIDLISNDPNSSIHLLMIGIDTNQVVNDDRNPNDPNYTDYMTLVNVGTRGSTDGWQSFSYLFTEDTAGTYDLRFTVNDRDDEQYRSYLAIDRLTICVKPDYGDINFDCHVDLLDFTIMASDWLCDCSDLGNLPDPNDCPWVDLGSGNIEVNLSGDIDGDDTVDVTDLQLMSEFWMFNE